MRLISRRVAALGLTLLMGTSSAFVEVPSGSPDKKDGRRLQQYGSDSQTVAIDSEGNYRQVQSQSSRDMAESRLWQQYSQPVTVNGKDAQLMLEDEAEYYVKKQRAKGYEPTAEQIAIHLYNSAMLDHIEANRDGPTQSLTSQETSTLIEAAVQSQQQKDHKRRTQANWPYEHKNERQRWVDGSQLMEYINAYRNQAEEDGEPNEFDLTRDEVVAYIRDTQAKGRPVPTQEEIVSFLADYGNGALVNAMSDQQIGDLFQAVTAELDRIQMPSGQRNLQAGMPNLIQAVASGLAKGGNGPIGNVLNNGPLNPMEILRFVQAQQASGKLPKRAEVVDFLETYQSEEGGVGDRDNVVRGATGQLLQKKKRNGERRTLQSGSSMETFITNFIESEKAAGNVPSQEEVVAAVKGHVSNDGVMSQSDIKQAAVTAIKIYKEWNTMSGQEGQAEAAMGGRLEGAYDVAIGYVGQQQMRGSMPTMEQVAGMVDKSARQQGIYLTPAEVEGIVGQSADKASILQGLKPITSGDVEAFVKDARMNLNLGSPLISEDLAAQGHNSLFSRVVALAEIDEVNESLRNTATSTGDKPNKARLRKT